MKHLSLLFIVLSICANTFGQIVNTRYSLSEFFRILSPERAAHLATLKPRSLGGTALEELQNITVLNDSIYGFAIVSKSEDEPIILAYGDSPIDFDHLSPTFVHILKNYDTLLGQGLFGESRRKAAPRKASFSNIGTLLSTTWDQGSPYNNMTPRFNGNNTLTGCVATAFAQVFNYHKLPKRMHGLKTYGYYTESNGNNPRVNLTLDYQNISFDWNNMRNSYKNWLGSTTGSEAERNAVAKLMYATGVLVNMVYGNNGSATFTFLGEDAINSCCDDLVAERVNSFDIDRVLTELSASRPVVYSAGGHCFVIDGARSDGYFHCNLGWGGSSDGYYLPTNMNGYTDDPTLVLIKPGSNAVTYTPIDELKGKYVAVGHRPATTIEPNRWYVMWNSGRTGSPCTKGTNRQIVNCSSMPTLTAAENAANQLVRFVPRNSNSYYIQTGLGQYWGGFNAWGGESKTTDRASNTFTLSSIASTYFAIKSSSCYIDTNGPGSTVVGWSTEVPTDTLSNSSWRFYPVNISDTEEVMFDGNKYYTLRNTGYSQGYLVSTASNDAQPTLRGVTIGHSNGILSDDYKTPVDYSNQGTYWRPVTKGGKHYLYNVGTKKYLTNQGNQTTYIFTQTETPINITKLSDGTYRLNSGTEAHSYLCAATQMQTPAAYWEITDQGSEWVFEEVEMPTEAESIEISHEELTLIEGQNFMLSASVLPETAIQNIQWKSTDTSVATIGADGVVHALKSGTATLTASSANNNLISASCKLNVLGTYTPHSLEELSTNSHYLLCNPHSQGFLVAIGEEDTHPTLRAVVTPHENGCIDDAYMSDLDLTTMYAFWQISKVPGGGYTLQNKGNKKYLTSPQVSRDYVFSETEKTLQISSASDGTFRINIGTGTDYYNSYLCAATQKENPASFWSNTDEGAIWTFIKVELPEPTYTLGDVNADQDINVADLTALVSLILNTANESYAREAADMNLDGNIDVTDYTLLVQKILTH